MIAPSTSSSHCIGAASSSSTSLSSGPAGGVISAAAAFGVQQGDDNSGLLTFSLLGHDPLHRGHDVTLSASRSLSAASSNNAMGHRDMYRRNVLRDSSVGFETEAKVAQMSHHATGSNTTQLFGEGSSTAGDNARTSQDSIRAPWNVSASRVTGRTDMKMMPFLPVLDPSVEAMIQRMEPESIVSILDRDPHSSEEEALLAAARECETPSSSDNTYSSRDEDNDSDTGMEPVAAAPGP
jgi:hypothetical protein